MGQRARWTLPDTVNPTEERCFIVRVPDEKFYIAAFRGALFSMAKAYSWENDSEHTALDVAARCLEMWNAIAEVDCSLSPTIQFRVGGSNCAYQVSVDGGVSWVDMPDYTQCAIDGATGVIQDLIDDGTLATGRQGPPQTKANPGSCTTYHGRVSAKDVWRLPVEVSAQDTVRILNASGGWNDGGQLEWRCPDGSQYILGACNPANEGTDPGDPLPTALHMRVIGHYNTTWVDPLTGAITIPAGVSNAQFFVQANDSDLTNNKGEITFDVEVCTGGWCYEFDIAGLSTWSPWITGGHTYGTYNGSVGWVANTFDQITIYAGYSCTFYHLEFEYTVNDTLGGTNHRDIAIGTANNPTDTLKTEGLVTGANRLMTWDGTPQTGVPFVSMYNGTIGLQNSNIHKVRIFGLDETCPFGTPNCA